MNDHFIQLESFVSLSIILWLRSVIKIKDTHRAQCVSIPATPTHACFVGELDWLVCFSLLDCTEDSKAYYNDHECNDSDHQEDRSCASNLRLLLLLYNLSNDRRLLDDSLYWLVSRLFFGI